MLDDRLYVREVLFGYAIDDMMYMGGGVLDKSGSAVRLCLCIVLCCYLACDT